MTPQEAIEELRDASDREVRYGDTKNHYDEVMKRIDAFDMAIKALKVMQGIEDAYMSELLKTPLERGVPISKQQPSEDCISKQAVIDIFEKHQEGSFAWGCMKDDIEQLPSVTPKAEGSDSK